MMTLSSLARRKLLFSPRLPILAGGPLLYLDAGARGDLDEPWSLMPPQSLSVVGFEPDAEECRRLNQGVPPHLDRKYFPTALWSEKTELDIHINLQPSTSSVYPANMEGLKKFAQAHWRPREEVRAARVPATTLDSIISQHGISPDFLKLDTQGAELPILKGAETTLRSHAIAVLAETWTTEVYKGQALSGELLSFMNQSGFSLFDFNVAAAWHHETAAAHGLRDKRQIVGLDYLFLREDFTLLGNAAGKVIKAAAIADMFGFSGAAIDFLDTCISQSGENSALAEARAFILREAQRGEGVVERQMRRIRRLLGGRHESHFARLH
jgi:FkbM family methyltransferase